MQNLQTLIGQLEKGRKLHISILDFSGILNTPLTKIEFKNVIHSKKFCDIAKSTPRGYRACMRSKRLANTKAITDGMPFGGQCIYGLYEAAVPVVMDKTVMAVVYAGNAVIDEKRTEDRIKKTCRHTGVSEKELCEQLNQCEYTDSMEELAQAAEIVSDYLKMLYSNAPKTKSELHWLVALMKHYADESFCSNICLKELAITYQKNEKYMGQLFKKEMGICFHQYCNGLRLQKAEKLLLHSDEKIIDISLDCGFNNISYFNRLFQKKYGVSPTEYRTGQKKSCSP